MTSKRALKILAWDGTYAADGTCNQGRPRRQAPAPSAPLPEGKGVSVRLRAVDPSFMPGAAPLAITISVKRAEHVQALMLRVADVDRALVYQEILDRDQIAGLPDAAAGGEHEVGDAAPRGTSPAATDEHAASSSPGGAVARAERSPYTVSVWVSTRAGAFDGLRLPAPHALPVPADRVAVPLEVYTQQVHDQSAMDPDALSPEAARHRATVPHRSDLDLRAKATRVQTDAIGTNQTVIGR
jgi:hypothetical protein